MLRGTASDPACEELRSLTRDALLTLIRALVVNKLDYCSSVMAGLPGSLMRRLQSVLNSAARLVYSARRSERVTPLLRELHWLLVPERIQFCLCTIIPRWDTASDVRHGITSSPAVRVYIELNGPVITTSYIGWPGIPRGCGTSLELITRLPASVRSLSSYLTFGRSLKSLLFDASFQDDWT